MASSGPKAERPSSIIRPGFQPRDGSSRRSNTVACRIGAGASFRIADQNLSLSRFIPFSRDQAFLLLPDLKAWVSDHDLAHFMAAVERVPIGAFRTGSQLAARPSIVRSDAGVSALLLRLTVSSRSASMNARPTATSPCGSSPRTRTPTGAAPISTGHLAQP